MERFGPLSRLAGWLLLLQVLSGLLIFAAIWMTVDFFESGNPELCACGLGMVPACVFWGFFAPKSARPEGAKRWLVLAGWAALTGFLWSRTNYGMLVSLPQVAVGTFLASLTSVHYGSALYFNTVRPAAVALAHILLPALFALGVWLKERWEEK